MKFVDKIYEMLKQLGEGSVNLITPNLVKVTVGCFEYDIFIENDDYLIKHPEDLVVRVSKRIPGTSERVMVIPIKSWDAWMTHLSGITGKYIPRTKLITNQDYFYDMRVRMLSMLDRSKVLFNDHRIMRPLAENESILTFHFKTFIVTVSLVDHFNQDREFYKFEVTDNSKVDNGFKFYEAKTWKELERIFVEMGVNTRNDA